MVVLFDTSAWIEFFEGTEKGKIVAEYIKSKQVFTSILSLVELVNWLLKSNKEDKIIEYINGVKSGSNILELNESIVIAAGKINFERKKLVKNWGMIDSLILSTVLIYNLLVLTKGSQFEGLNNVKIM